MEGQKAFEPAKHLSLVSGNEYLVVKWRLVWLRSEHPDASIETELVKHANGEAIFRANVSIPGGGSSTGYGSEDTQSFGDYIEKAETKAIGRALAALGFGTQFCMDFDFGASHGKVVDAPVNTRGGGGYSVSRETPASGGGYNGPAPSSTDRATAKQMGAIWGAKKRNGISDQDFGDLCYDTVGVRDIGDHDDRSGEVPNISKADASAIIQALMG